MSTFANLPTLATYTGLITSQHRERPNFIATLSAVLQGFVDGITTLDSIIEKFDLDLAAGQQLDYVGQWVGLTRYLRTPISGVYFSFDTDGLGWDEGVWWAPGDPTEGAISMDDTTYRIMLKAKVAANHWDGSLEQMNTIYNYILEGTGVVAKVQDNFDLTITIWLSGPVNALFQQIVSEGYIPLRPAGVSISWVF